MKGIRVLTVAVCICCFLIGYLAYLGTSFFFDFFKGQIDPCENQMNVCSQTEIAPR